MTEVVGGQARTLPLVAEKLLQEPRPEPRPGHPYLQSARLTVPMAPPRLQKGMLLKVKQLQTDLGLPPRPLPTKVRACVASQAGGQSVGRSLHTQPSSLTCDPFFIPRRCATSTTTCGGTRWSSSRS